MKYKRSEKGFAHYLALLVFVVIAIGLSGWYVAHHRPMDNSQPAGTGYLPGALNIRFKDGTTSEQALSVIKSFGLHASISQQQADYTFTPKLQEQVSASRAGEVIQQLEQNPEVSSVDSNGFDTQRHYSQDASALLTITFKQEATSEQISQIIASVGITDSKPYVYNNDRVVGLAVSAGQEDAYLKKLLQNPQIKSATRVVPTGL